MTEDEKRVIALLEKGGQLYQAGRYGEATSFAQQACDLAERHLGGQHPGTATSLNNLAVLYHAQGRYAEAEPLHQRALAIRERAFGPDHPSVATSLHNLANLYRAQGRYAEAEPLYRRALAIWEQALGPDHPAVATSLSNLAELYRAQGRTAEAEPLHRRALAIRELAFGPDHPDVATSLNNLAVLYHAQDRYAEAEPLCRRALAIMEQFLGPDHPAVATSLSNLAVLYRAQGRYAEAEPLCWRALAIRERAFGPDHPDMATSLNSLAELLAATGRAAEALTHAERASRIDDRLIGQMFACLSERQRAAYLDTLRGSFDGYLSLVARHLAAEPAAVQAALDLVLRRKALGAEAIATQRDAVLGGRYPHLQPRLRELTALRMQIAQNTLVGPGDGDLQAYRQQLAEWAAQRERLEADLARQIPELNLTRRLAAADRQAVANALPKDTVLVEFVRFTVYDFQAVPAQGERLWKEARYLAFVLPAGEPDRVQMLDLGEAVFIDQRIARFRAALTGELEQGRDLGARPTVSPSRPDEAEGLALRQALFDPLLPALGDRQQLLLSPDGDLTRLPFEVLPTDDGQRLIDRYRLSYLAAGRDALRFGALPTATPAAPLIAADPDFDLGGGKGQPQPVAGRRSRDLDRAHLHFTPLPGTRAEGEHLAAMLKVQPWLAGAALETQLKAQRSPRILHLATHGFFLEDQKYDPEKAQRMSFIGSEMNRLAGSGLENPLLRSGLALAGVNTWLQGKPCPPDAEDGLLTAEDVTGLDLLDTELVVLSACETGLGDVRIGEGVMGLRRSFVLAGAKTLVMSLWKVPDQQTQELMEDFYRRLLKGQPRAEALREAQRAMKAQHPEPLYWGAFICQGELGPLSNLPSR